MEGTLVDALLKFPSEEHVEKVCQPGKGEKTCRYLTMGFDGWGCEKSGSLKRTIDVRVANGTMNAKGDNCGGLLGLILEKQKELVGKRVEHEESVPTYRSAGPFKKVTVKNGVFRIVWDDNGEKDSDIYLDYLDITIGSRSITFGVTGLGSFGGTTTVYLVKGS